MAKPFSRVTLYARHYRANREVGDTLGALASHLSKRRVNCSVEHETAQTFPHIKLPVVELTQVNQEDDLIIVVGGDGSLLSAAQTAAQTGAAILGINRGHLGFLTDINPTHCEPVIDQILEGQYREEQRFLLAAHLEKTLLALALNDVVIMPGQQPHLVALDIFINEEFVCEQRADGMIIATPTGSTAYALSAGGPILHPALDAMVLVPMFPHTLSTRPIVVAGDSQLRIRINERNESSPRLNCDGQSRVEIAPGQDVLIRKHPQSLRLIHPLDYNYYETLRSKLGWENKLKR